MQLNRISRKVHINFVLTLIAVALSINKAIDGDGLKAASEHQVPIYRNGLYGWPLNAMNAKGIFPFDGKVPLIAVIDTGVFVESPFLPREQISNVSLNIGIHKYSILHGTMVIGLIIGQGNGWSTPGGLLPRAKILSIQVGNSTGISESELAQAIYVAVHRGAKIINISLGSHLNSTKLASSVTYALSRGVVIVAAAGNEGLSSNDYPSAIKGVIPVSTITNNDQLGDNTNINAIRNIAAPGDLLLTTASGTLIHNSLGWLSGSSAATPIVASTVAVLFAKFPKLTPSQVYSILLKSSNVIRSARKSIHALNVKMAIKMARAIIRHASSSHVTESQS